MHLGSVYVIARDYKKSIQFYEALLEMSVTSQNMERFAQFEFDGKNISILNAYFDANNPSLTVHKGENTEKLDNLVAIAEAENSHKVVFNFWTENLKREWNRLKKLKLSDIFTGIKYLNNVAPYYYFQLTDPDGNVIEITGVYEPQNEEFNV